MNTLLNPLSVALACALFCIAVTTPSALASSDHKDHSNHDDQGPPSTHIKDRIAARAGVTTALSGPKTLHQTITSFGVLTAGPEQLSHVRARYPGLLMSVTARIGDKVKAGDLLATVESDNSLKTYKITAPINGVIVQRHANRGESAREQILFSIANYDTLWAEFRIYPQQHGKVQKTQAVHVVANQRELDSQISHIIPALDKPYQIARVALDNTQLGLSPGLLIEGHIAIGSSEAVVAVDNQSLQELDGATGVFVKDGEDYRFTPVLIGASDDRYSEILRGIPADVEYVNGNSYLIKADIEKSAAEHVH